MGGDERKIRIEDLAEPVLNDFQKAALGYAEQNPVELTVDAVLHAAREQTGLDDFGPDDFRERLGLWVGEVDDDEDRTALGRMTVYNDCVRYAASRLRIHAFVAAHPEVQEIPIERPIIVIGLPRSGTTHLVNLIAADERLRSMPLWEGQEPVPRRGEGTREGRERASTLVMRRSARLNWEMPSALSSAADRGHASNGARITSTKNSNSCCPDFSSYNLEWICRARRAGATTISSHDQTSALRVHEARR